MDRSLPIEPLGPFDATIRPPGSKSLTNRALLLAALAQGESALSGVLQADDTQRMLRALADLGVILTPETQASSPDSSAVRISGCGGRWPKTNVQLDLGNAGTAFRFLTAACCLAPQGPVGKQACGTCLLDGIERMRQRPIGQLVDALRLLGGQIDYRGQDGFPPLTVAGTGLTGGEITLAPTLSSQYLSALLQVGPYCARGLTIQFDGPVTSRPYVEMTLALMQKFGVHADVDPAFTRITILPGGYRGTDYAIEPDASNASYFLAAAAIVPGSRCTIEGLGRGSLQGDVGFADVLHQMGAGLIFGRDFITVSAPAKGESLRGLDVDLNAMPDMAQTLATLALFAEGATTIRNIGNLRVKETDRLAALQNELTKLGARVEIDGDDLTIEPPPVGRINPGAIDTYNDHRMAMSFAIVGLRAPGITINDPRCVDKTFPGFFEYLGRLAAKSHA